MLLEVIVHEIHRALSVGEASRYSARRYIILDGLCRGVWSSVEDSVLSDFFRTRVDVFSIGAVVSGVGIVACFRDFVLLSCFLAVGYLHN